MAVLSYALGRLHPLSIDFHYCIFVPERVKYEYIGRKYLSDMAVGSKADGILKIICGEFIYE